ncbi:DEAD/DEAH box helicase [Limnoglobus roseus]|uniref:Helicase Snf2 n=1 Tax=Limnoglobus roseus TaxID=2598579 RepID=A0A5C1A8S5_9BACT|nr:DEAD/DEAH box helicase [Limnoglobus roseus]QEL14593.1 helicase Snf2 [Limnoglobus roseus]
MLREEQIDIRRQRAKASRFVIENLTKKRVFSEYRVTNPESKGQYTVTVHGFDVGDNSCTCPDFKSNTLGTCKHIEAVLEELKDDLPAHLQKKKATFTRPEVYLHYGDPWRVGVHLPARHSDKLGQLAKRFFDDKGLWHGKGRFEDLIPEIQRVPEEVTVLSDAMEYIEREVEQADMLQKERAWLEQLGEGKIDWQPLHVPLYDYQMRGAIFLACRGRSILGDDMGLGKTVQTLAAVEILVRERNINRVLVISPSSVKYQWATEIQKFTSRAVQIIDGSPEARQAQYLEPTFYRLVNYEQVVRDRDAINAWKPDVVVLDEAQRIKNWESKTSREVKRLKSPYAMVLTGTPLENRLEELFSIVQFVDERRFGPAFQFLSDHRILDADGNLKGYRNLDTIREKLEPIFLRRTRAEVLTQLPARTDNTVFVELSDEQRQPYEDQKTMLARLMQKGYLTDVDRKRILACIVNMRMVCDSTFLFDKQTHVSPKLDELAELIPELLEDDAHKIVAFSQWETMVNEAAALFAKLDVGHTILHGGLPGKERQAVLKKFQTDPECRVFLSTDAGGTGLNLQIADTVVNLELPWNPAVLEQRIARVHRMGQSRPVRVVNLVTRGTIEERVLRTLEQKQNLFAGIFDGDDDEVTFTNVASGTLMKAVRDLLTDPKAGGEAVATARATIPGGSDVWRAAAAFLESLAASEAGPPDDVSELVKAAIQKLRTRLEQRPE